MWVGVSHTEAQRGIPNLFLKEIPLNAMNLTPIQFYNAALQATYLIIS
jgi:hypothetical protein